MSSRMAWTIAFTIAGLFWLLVLAPVFAAGIPQDAERTPRIEFMCDGLPDVVFNQDGSLGANGKEYRLEAGHQGMLFFSEGVTLRGELVGDNVYFDRSQIIVGGKKFECVAV